MNTADKASAIILIEQLRLIESELFRLSSKYGVKTVQELDNLIEQGKLSESTLGDDLFQFDYLTSEKKRIELELQKLSIKKEHIWENFQNLLDLPKLNIRT